MTRQETQAFIKTLAKLRESLTDAQASTAAEVYPTLKNDSSLVSVGTRINWNGTIKRAAVDLWDTTENNPDNAPNLWEDINYKNGYRIIPEIITAGTAFGLDEYGYWKDVLYKSLITNNVWTPEQYSAAWEVVI
jgi:hypothetical protein